MLVGQRGPPLRIALRFVQCARRAADCSLRSPAGDACVWRGQPCGMIAAPADSEVRMGGCVPAPACGGSPCCWCHGMCHPLTRRAWGGEPGVGPQQAVPAQGAVERAAPGSTLPPQRHSPDSSLCAKRRMRARSPREKSPRSRDRCDRKGWCCHRRCTRPALYCGVQVGERQGGATGVRCSSEPTASGVQLVPLDWAYTKWCLDYRHGCPWPLPAAPVPETTECCCHVAARCPWLQRDCCHRLRLRQRLRLPCCDRIAVSVVAASFQWSPRSSRLLLKPNRASSKRLPKGRRRLGPSWALGQTPPCFRYCDLLFPELAARSSPLGDLSYLGRNPARLRAALRPLQDSE